MDTGIRTYYTGGVGEIRYSRYYSLNKKFNDKSNLSFKYVLKGQEHYVVDGKHFEIKEKQVLFFSNNKPYEGFIDYPSITQGLCIDLNIDIGKTAQVDALNEEQMFFFSPEFKTQKINFLDEYLHSLLQQIVLGDKVEQSLRYEEILQEISTHLLHMEKEYVERIASIPTKNEAYKKELFVRLITAKNFIQDQKRQKITLSEIAKESGLSAYYLHRLFKRVFGYTPAQYQEKIRMLEAKEYLKFHSAKETCYIVGFSDEAYFSRRFKLYFGMPPGKYTRLNR